MANSAGTAYVDVRGDTSGVERDIDRGVTKASDKAAKSVTSNLGGAFKTVGGIIGGAFVGTKVLQLGADILQTGLQVEVFGKKAKTVFEGSTADVTKWAKANASAFGITDDTLIGLAASFGDLLKPMGFTSAEAANMSTKVVGLSGALSAWSGNTRSAAEVSQILAKAMLGERDGLKELGISISEADVQARLLLKGQQDLTGEALAQAKALATQELIFEKSADAQKAWADGSLDAIKKQNALKEKVAELREDLAEKLLPAFAAVTEWLVDKFIPGLERIVPRIGDFLSKLEPVGRFISDHIAGFTQLAEVIGVTMVARLAALQAQALITFGTSTIAAITGYTTASTAAAGATEAMGAASLGVLGPAAALTGAIVLLTRTTADHIPAVNGFLDRLFTLEGMLPGVGGALADLDRAVFGVGKTSDDTSSRVQTLHERLLDYARGYEATVTIDASQAFRTLDELRSELATVNANIERSGPGGGNRAAANQLEEEIATRSDEAPGDDPTTALPDRAHGMDEGPLPGPLGKPLLIRAHGGEWVLTPEQMADLRSGRSGGSAPGSSSGGAGIDYERLAQTLAAVLAANPSRSYVVASDVSRGQHKSRRP